jgi:hypothetical protein
MPKQFASWFAASLVECDKQRIRSCHPSPQRKQGNAGCVMEVNAVSTHSRFGLA